VKTLANNTSQVTSLTMSDDLSFLLCGLDNGAILYSTEDLDINWKLAKLQDGLV